MNQFGEVRVFELEDLFKALTEACFQQNLFREFVGTSGDQVAERFFSTVEIRPGIFGITVDIKAAITILRELVGRGNSEQRLYPH